MDNARAEILKALWNRDTKTAGRIYREAKYEIQRQLKELDEIERAQHLQEEPPQCP